MYTAPLGGAAARNKKERKVSLVFRHPESGTKHCSGVESVLLVPGYKILFTASRDSTIKRWNVAGPTPWFEASFEGHTDWVNDIVLMDDVLISCSNDKTVRVWRGTSSPGLLISTLTHHTDYVTRVAASPQRSIFASAGLRGEVFLVDLNTMGTVQVYPKAKNPADKPLPLPRLSGDSGAAGGGCSRSHDTKGSIYGLALSASGTILAAGGADHMVRLWDSRTDSKVAKLRGHSDYVRTLLVKADGSLVLSGSSDGTVKLWDVGMQRCVQTFKVHSDSVWALLASDDFQTVYSGGRDKSVFKTNLSTRTAELFLTEQRPVRSMALDDAAGDGLQGGGGSGGHHHGHGQGQGALWVSTDSSSVNKWQVGGPAANRAFPVFERRSYCQRLSLDVYHSMEPLSAKPSAVIQGVPAIVAHKVLNDRRHVLTKDTDGNAVLWDVLSGSVVQSYGQVPDLDAKERELFEPQSVPSWFSPDVKLGQLAISLEPPSCFLTEDYALLLGYPDVAEDVKVNYGKLVLECAFAKWRKQAALLEKVQAAAQGPTSPSGRPQAPAAAAGAAGAAAAAAGTDPETQAAAAAAAAGVVAAADGPVYEGLWPRYWEPGAVIPAVMSQTSTGLPWRMLASQFTGREGEPDVLPTWLVEAVVRGSNVIPKESKIAFILLPDEGSNMPSLMQSKLNAPRILQVHKVAHYCLAKLTEQNIHLEVQPQYLRRPAHVPPEQPAATSDKPVLELLCNGMGVPYEMSLASVKRYIWRKGDDLVFHFRVRDPNSPAPLPVIKP